jgi:hypothetical protein
MAADDLERHWWSARHPRQVSEQNYRSMLEHPKRLLGNESLINVPKTMRGDMYAQKELFFGGGCAV